MHRGLIKLEICQRENSTAEYAECAKCAKCAKWLLGWSLACHFRQAVCTFSCQNVSDTCDVCAVRDMCRTANESQVPNLHWAFHQDRFKHARNLSKTYAHNLRELAQQNLELLVWSCKDGATILLQPGSISTWYSQGQGGINQSGAVLQIPNSASGVQLHGGITTFEAVATASSMNHQKFPDWLIWYLICLIYWWFW